MQVPEHEEEGDCVTKIHLDMADAVNVMLHCHHSAPAPPSSALAAVPAAAAAGPSAPTGVPPSGGVGGLPPPRSGLEPSLRGSW